MIQARVAILVDAGFLKKKLGTKLSRFPTSQDVLDFCRTIMSKPRLANHTLFRVYYYDAPPYIGKAINPLSKIETNYSTTPQAQQHQALLESLKYAEDFAVRQGAVAIVGWKLKKKTMTDLTESKRSSINGDDLEPDFEQKAVDIRIGLDIAWLSIKKIVNVIVLVTSDADFIPAMKFARREGLKIYLETLGHKVYPELKQHADCVFS